MEDVEFKKILVLCDNEDCKQIAQKQFKSQDQFGTVYMLNLCEHCAKLDNVKCKHKRFVYSFTEKPNAPTTVRG